MSFYHVTAGSFNATLGLWEASGSAFAKSTLEPSTGTVPNPGLLGSSVSGAKLKLTAEYAGSSTWEFYQVGTNFLMRSGFVGTTPLSQMSLRGKPSGTGDVLVTRLIMECDSSNTVVSRQVERWHGYSWGSGTD